MNAVHPTSNWTWRDLRLWSVDGFVLPFWGWNSDPFLQIPAYFSTCRIMFWRMTDRTSAVASGNHCSLIVFGDRSIVSTFILHKISTSSRKKGVWEAFFFSIFARCDCCCRNYRMKPLIRSIRPNYHLAYHPVMCALTSGVQVETGQ